MIAVSYGAGLNSTALLVGLWERGVTPDHITFADTKGETPATYQHLEYMQEWCRAKGFPAIVIVTKVDKHGDEISLEQHCLNHNMLPSLAYGFKSCSIRHKVAPMDKYFNNLPSAKTEWKEGRKIVKYIGYDADEPQRAKIEEDAKYIYEWPLIDWDWGRDECREAIIRGGVHVPPKSSCFFCPAHKQHEIRRMATVYPDLAERALQMESNAELQTVRGLGRSFAWKDLLATDEMFPESYQDDIPCGCYDG
jgi:hypothetical protein